MFGPKRFSRQVTGTRFARNALVLVVVILSALGVITHEDSDAILDASEAIELALIEPATRTKD